MKPEEKISKATIHLVLDHPFFGALLMRLKIMETPFPHRTAWTDGIRLGYNKRFIDMLSVKMVLGLLAHEVAHLALKHHLRRGERDVTLWKRACDYAVNRILIEAGIELPPGGLFDERFSGMSAERVYNILQQEQQQQLQLDDLPDPTDDSQPEDEDDPVDGSPPDNPFDNDDDSEPEDEDDPMDGSPPDDPFDNDDGSWGDILDLPEDITEKEIAEAEEDWDLAVVNANAVAKACGKEIESVERHVQGIMETEIDWRELLREFAERTVGRDDYTYLRPNRRHSEGEFIIPSLSDGFETPKIVVGCDTSISIDDEELKAFATEIGSVLEEFDCSFLVIYCDTDVRHTQELTSDNLPFTLEAKGGGGTILAPVFQYIIDHDIEHEAIIFFSDMYCSNFGREPEKPVIWLNTGGEGGRMYAERHNCFGTIVDIEL